MQVGDGEGRRASGLCETLLLTLSECDGAAGIRSPLREASSRYLLARLQESIRFFAVDDMVWNCLLRNEASRVPTGRLWSPMIIYVSHVYDHCLLCFEEVITGSD